MKSFKFSQHDLTAEAYHRSMLPSYLHSAMRSNVTSGGLIRAFNNTF